MPLSGGSEDRWLGSAGQSDAFIFSTSGAVATTGLSGSAKPENPGGGGGGGGKGGGNNGGNGSELLDKYTSGDTGAPQTSFNIEVVFEGGGWTEALQQTFIDAADLISTIITGDLPDVFFRGKTIDDVRIEAEITEIDGSGGILGQAGPTAYRTASFLPAKGIMEFDVADAEDYDAIGLFNDIVFHEMMHVLGFGTMWDLMGLTSPAAGGGLEFTGSNANLAFDAEFTAAQHLAVETEGGGGTAGGHWNEGGTDGFAFDNEIMTGYIDIGNYLSNTSIAALEDMGYDTVFDAANPLGATSGLDLSILNDHLVA